MRKLAFSTLGGLLASGVLLGTQDVAGQGPRTRQVEVFVRTKPTPLIEHAAQEFASYAGKMLGREVPVIVTAEPRPKGNVAVLLDTNGSYMPVMRMIGPRQLLPENKDAFIIRGLNRQGVNYLVISGRTDRSTLYGVYHYLEKICHVGFFKDGERVPKLEALPVEGISVTETPAMELRSTGGGLNWEVFHSQDASEFLKKYETGPAGLVGLQPYTRGDYVTDWLAKKKQNWGGPGGKNAQLIAFEPPIRSDVYYVGRYAADVLKMYPKAIPNSGFSNWRGPRYYGGAWYVDVGEDAEEVTRRLNEKEFAKQVPENESHFYWIGWSAEDDAWNAFGADMVERTVRLNLKRDPRAKYLAEAYSCRTIHEAFKANIPLMMFDNTMDNSALPPRMWRAGSATSNSYYYGTPWLWVLMMGGGDNSSYGCQQYIRAANLVGTKPEYSNCVGMTTYVDAVSPWWMDDLWAELNWGLSNVSFESWAEDLSKRRFGEDGLNNMVESFRAFIRGIDNLRLYGWNRYRYHWHPTWRFNELYWYRDVARDWHLLVDGMRDVKEMRTSLELALGESQRQKGNDLYDLYLVDAYRYYSIALWNYPLIRLHSHYYQATRALAAGDKDAARRHVAAFEKTALYLDLVLEQLEKVFSTRDEYCLSPSFWNEDQRRNCWRGLQSVNRDCFDFMHWIIRPSVKLMVEEERKRLQRGETELISHRSVAPWFRGAEPYYYYYAGGDEETRQRERGIVEKFIEGFKPSGRAKGSTADVIRESLAILDRSGAGDFPDMHSREAIGRNYPLSDPAYRWATTQPVQESASGKGAWRQKHYAIRPFWVGAQVVYGGPYIGDWVEAEEGGGIKLQFTYRNASSEFRGSGTDVSAIVVGLQCESDNVVSFNFFNNGSPRPEVEFMRRNPVREQLDGPASDGARPAGGDAIAAPLAEVAGAEHRVAVEILGTKLTVSGDQFPQPLTYTLARPYARAALVISSYYPEYGPHPELWIRDIRLNGREIALYTDEWPV